jgi:hypothetical protein
MRAAISKHIGWHFQPNIAKNGLEHAGQAENASTA